MKKLFKNKIFILCLVSGLFVLVFAGFTGWYYYDQKNNQPETNLVPKAQTTETTESIDQDISSIDNEMNAVNEQDFSDSELSDGQVGL